MNPANYPSAAAANKLNSIEIRDNTETVKLCDGIKHVG